MEGFEYILILLAALTLFSFIIGNINKRNDDFGSAGVYNSIGFILLILTIILFLYVINQYGVIPEKTR